MAQTTKTLRDSLKAVLDLQRKWSADNTEPMQEQGALIRSGIPVLLKPLTEQHGVKIEGSDGAGWKARVPWVRLYDPRFSPSAREGWYIVFLGNNFDRHFQAAGSLESVSISNRDDLK